VSGDEGSYGVTETHRDVHHTPAGGSAFTHRDVFHGLAVRSEPVNRAEPSEDTPGLAAEVDRLANAVAGLGKVIDEAGRRLGPLLKVEREREVALTGPGTTAPPTSSMLHVRVADVRGELVAYTGQLHELLFRLDL
jgi:hypothetical protein